MRDFVRDYGKIAAACAAGAFVLSFLVGLVTRNPFGVVVLRALLLALIFAALGAGMRFVVRKYLPEISEREGSPAENTTGATRGTRIDIVLPEERPEAIPRSRPVPRESGRRAPAPSGGVDPLRGQSQETEDLPLEDGGASQAEAAALDELASELADELPSGSSESAGQEEEIEELRPMGRRKGNGEERIGGAEGEPGAEEDLDALPDISNLEIGTDPGSGRASARAQSSRPGGESPQEAMRGAVSGQDPATIARAIRTVLKRDEKG